MPFCIVVKIFRIITFIFLRKNQYSFKYFKLVLHSMEMLKNEFRAGITIS